MFNWVPPMSLELTIKTPKQHQARHYYVFIVDFEHILHIGFYAYFSYFTHKFIYFHSFEQVNLCETSKCLPGLFHRKSNLVF